MARNKNVGGRKVPRTENPLVSSSPPRSPSPPKPPTPKSSSSASFETVSESLKSLSECEVSPEIQSTPFESPDNSPIHLTQTQPQSPSPIESPSPFQNPTNNEDSPSPIAIVPSPKDTPPALVKIKKSKSFDFSKIRRSSRIMSGAGKKPVVDTTVHVLDPSDSETTLLEKEIDNFELEPITSTKSGPVKAKKTPTPKKRLLKLLSKLLEPRRRMYNFGELSQGGVDLVKYIEPFEWKSFFHIKDIVYPLLVQAFYFNAKVHPDRDLLTSNIKDVELVVDPFVIGSLIGIKSEGVEVYGNDWYDQVKINKEHLKKEMFVEERAKKHAPPSSLLKTEYKLLHNMCQHSFFLVLEAMIRKREVFENTNLNVLVDASGDRLENALQTDGNTQISGDAKPTTESEKLVTTATTTLQGFKPVTAQPGTTMFSPLMASSQGSLSSFCTSEFIRNILTSETPEISTMSVPNPTDSTLPSIPSSFATFDSFCSSANVVNAGTKKLMFEGNNNFDFPGPSRPAKRSRDWFTFVVCPQLHLPPPPEIEAPQFDPFPAPNNNSDDDCPATSPAPDGANE
ncbi:hypothetical protein TSUD_297660 [Trifolium subterraneum]|uniref:Uncharacterized protein n=1 Tax=Trifolium subterraneum TaxID=3900 RepID=A0A2Z6LTD6_TRISU|nr:hypothetical protein TSUD_297660 [Trifolium subterraneum]